MRKVSVAQKKFVAGRQNYKCANNPEIQLFKIQNYKCPLWRNNGDGSFDEAGYEIDHIEEYSISQNNNMDNLQALCLSCHKVKTKQFLISKKRNRNIGAIKNQKNEIYKNSLFEACKKGDVQLVKDTLFNHKYDSIDMNKGFDIALTNGYMHLAKFLKDSFEVV